MSDHRGPPAVSRLVVGLAVAALVVSLSSGAVTVGMLFGGLSHIALSHPWMPLPVKVIYTYGPIATWSLTGASAALLALCVWRRLCGRAVIVAAGVLTGLAAFGGAVPPVAIDRWMAREFEIVRDKARAHPEDARAQLEYSGWLARRGEVEEALTVAEKARSLADEHLWNYEVKVGLLNLALGDAESALPPLRSAYERREDVRREYEAFSRAWRDMRPAPDVSERQDMWSRIALREVQHIQRSYIAGLIIGERWDEAAEIATSVAADSDADYIEWFLNVLLERATADAGSGVQSPKEAEQLSPERRQWLTEQMERWRAPLKAKERLMEWAHGYVSASAR